MASVFSMTGYATIQSAIASGQLTVELRSVNSRFLDLTLRIPDDLHSLESAIRETIGSRVKRGKMECRLSLTSEPVCSHDARVPAGGSAQSLPGSPRALCQRNSLLPRRSYV